MPSELCFISEENFKSGVHTMAKFYSIRVYFCNYSPKIRFCGTLRQNDQILLQLLKNEGLQSADRHLKLHENLMAGHFTQRA